MRPETTYNNYGKSSYANFEIGPDLNKPYVQVVKQQVKMHQDDLYEILVKLHIKFIHFGATAYKIWANQVKTWHTMHTNINQTPQNKDATWYYEATCKTKQVSYKAHSKRSNGSTHTFYTSLKDKLSKTATRHIASIKTICYSTTTWKQKTWTWCTGKALQNINTELSLEITRTCSNTHSKIVSNNNSRLCRK